MLGAAPGVVQAVVTGNIRPVALVKLGVFGLLALLATDLGAYGGEAPTRAGLVQLARARATAAAGECFEGTRTVVIGDTPSDIEAAHAAGATAIGVATGHFTADALAASGADVVCRA